jgi:vacuolar-type H+-ATPase subunit E/Vma4
MAVLPETKVLDKEALGQLERLANPPGTKTLQELMADGWDALSGEDYTIRVGEKQQDILKKIGPPIAKYQKPLPLDRPFDEAWEYSFCLIYFRKDRVRELVFKKVDGPSYYEGAVVVDFPPTGIGESH